ncbi:hypothetical protein SBA6_470058 [Candidatus Sulfopaludibacter sp. SbA6]|nr:hypothetical protein SBA6_470058 [Candidatus Sulfopaludibacter sp. SbA6]
MSHIRKQVQTLLRELRDEAIERRPFGAIPAQSGGFCHDAVL